MAQYIYRHNLGGESLQAVEAGPRRMRLLKYLLVAVMAIGLVSARPQAEDTEEEEEEDEGVDEAEYDYDLVGAGGGKHFFNATIRLSLDIICSISNNAWPRVQLVNFNCKYIVKVGGMAKRTRYRPATLLVILWLGPFPQGLPPSTHRSYVLAAAFSVQATVLSDKVRDSIGCAR